MNFNNEYKQAFSEIKAEESFKKRLVDELEQSSVPKAVKGFSSYAKVLALAAVLVFMIGIGYFSQILQDRSQGAKVPEDMLAGESIEDLESVGGMMAGNESAEGYMDLNIPSADEQENVKEDTGIQKFFSDLWKNIYEFFD